MTDLQALFGHIDIYLFDQLLRGRAPAGARMCDAGCGSGRNLAFVLREGYDVRAVDAEPAAIDLVRSTAERLAPDLPADNFRLEPVEEMSFRDRSVDFVISSAVLHFARDDDHFEAILRECWRVLERNGIFFCRLLRASSTRVGAKNQASRCAAPLVRSRAMQIHPTGGRAA